MPLTMYSSQPLIRRAGCRSARIALVLLAEECAIATLKLWGLHSARFANAAAMKGWMACQPANPAMRKFVIARRKALDVAQTARDERIFALLQARRDMQSERRIITRALDMCVGSTDVNRAMLSANPAPEQASLGTMVMAAYDNEYSQQGHSFSGQSGIASGQGEKRTRPLSEIPHRQV